MPIVLLAVGPHGNDLQIRFHMQAADCLALQGDLMIDAVRNAGAQRRALSLGIKTRDRNEVGPSRRSLPNDSLALAGMGCRQFPLGPAFAAARFWRLVLAGALGMFVAILPISPVARAVGALALFIALLFAGRVLNLAELRRMGRLLAR